MKPIQNMCTSQNIWESSAHIPGTQNPEVDSFSKNFIETVE